MESYDGILKRMEDAYEEKSGCRPEAVSDIGLRLRVLAGEIYRAQEQVAWLKRQAFPQTAEGEYLDMHGAQRGLLREQARRAEGELTFTRYVPLAFDVVVPKGTVCASSGGEGAVEYETTVDAVLAAGGLSVAVPAQAVEPGAGGNAAAGYINTMSTPVTGIQYVSNRTPFTGGADREGDGPYRDRLLESFQKPILCGNLAYYEQLAKATPGVTSAQAVADSENPGTVIVYVWGDGAAPEEEALAALQAELSKKRELGTTVSVRAATGKKVHLYVRLSLPAGMDFTPVKARVEALLQEWMGQRQIGDPVQAADVFRLVLAEVPAVKIEMNPSMAGCAAAVGVIPLPGTMYAGVLT